MSGRRKGIAMKIWEADYKGHRIKVENSVSLARLIVDGEIQDAYIGILAFNVRLSGRLKNGDGAGEQIKAVLGSGFFAMKCHIFVDDTLIV